MAQLEISFHNNVSCVLQCIQSQKTIDNIPCNIGEITCLFEDLSIGKINPYSYSLRKKELLCFSSPFALSKHEFNDFHKKLENADSIRVFSSFCPNEYLGLCYVCYKIYPRIRKIELCMPLDNEKYFYTMPLSVRTVEEIELLIDQTTVVSTKEYAEIFEWVLKENSDLRIMRNREIVSVSLDYYDKYIQEKLNENIPFNDLSANLCYGWMFQNENTLNGYYADTRIKYLMSRNHQK